ncbi:hypothetical protein MVI01_12010 [Myxococcus virescens]|uniref:Uncharacterized protein n=1 Tax=Myxococcus virescens TaxID=83456 RepID=A0A511H7C5_9BACT|nr:hypothetical protein MVI01_12010 [Myxococcus virescens]
MHIHFDTGHEFGRSLQAHGLGAHLHLGPDAVAHRYLIEVGHLSDIASLLLCGSGRTGLRILGMGTGTEEEEGGDD